MKVPGAEGAYIDLAKLRDYCLCANHAEGKHKARVFRSALGLEAEDSEWLRDQLLIAVAREDCWAGPTTGFGHRFVLDSTICKHGREAKVRSAWIIRAGEDFPRLVSCYVL